MSRRVLIVDDHLLFAEGIKSQLERRGKDAMDIDILTDGSKAVSTAASDPPYDLLLLDLHMPGVSGLDLLTSLQRKGVPTPILVVTAETDADVAMRVLESGARGYISKGSGSALMLEAIKRVGAGEIFLDPDIPAVASADGTECPAPTVIPPRTLEVLDLIARGYPNKRVASALEISESTVKWHVSRLFDSLDVNNRTACVAEAVRIGLIERPE